MNANLDSAVLAILFAEVRHAQANLEGYLATGAAPARATPLVDPDLVPLALALKLLPHWSKSTARRPAGKHRPGAHDRQRPARLIWQGSEPR
jgi:hypothetical protein